MAKGSSNPMQEHHRKARSKEMQKNKQRRTKERDDIVLQTKTIQEVREEIDVSEREMKRHAGNPQGRGNSERKIARLQKELKILQEAAEEAAAAKAKALADSSFEDSLLLQQQQQKQQRPLTELDDPRKSVYYDVQLNPYGAPPPGKPRLYHRRWGGVTLNPHDAIVPGEEQVPPPPPPTRPPPPPPPRYNNNNRFGYGQGHGPPHNSQSRYQHPGRGPLPHNNHQRPNQQQRKPSDMPPPNLSLIHI